MGRRVIPVVFRPGGVAWCAAAYRGVSRTRECDVVEIRQATLSDVPSLVGLVGQYWAYEGVPGFDPALVSAQLTRPLTESGLGCLWIAAVDGASAGCLLTVYVFSLEHYGLAAEIDGFFVTAECRNRGIGSALLRAAESALTQTGCTSLYLQLSRANDSARTFYRQRGYAERSRYDLLWRPLRRGRC